VLDGYLTLARLRQAQNDAAGLNEALTRATDFARQFDATELDDRLVEAHRARLWALGARFSQVAEWAERRGLWEQAAADLADPARAELPYPSGYFSAIEYPVLARLLIGRDQPGEALAILDGLLAPLERQGRWGAVIEVEILRALALDAMGDPSGAISALANAIRLAEPEGYVRLFADENGSLASLLRRAAAQGIAPAYVGRLLAAIGADEPALRQATMLVEPLSERELEVLRLIAAGLSNQEIADQLVLAVSTIKWHINNLYGKLDVGSRTQAVARARELDLI
jgi:LuxR family maltose regulon positive regulatory protein